MLHHRCGRRWAGWLHQLDPVVIACVGCATRVLWMVLSAVCVYGVRWWLPRRMVVAMVYIGIDNGLSGALVALDARGRLVASTPMPTVKMSKKSARRAYRPREVYLWLSQWVEGDAYVCQETAQAFPITGKAACFSIGLGAGLIEGMLIALSLPYQHVRPKEWQGVVLKGIPGESKERSILKTEQAVPELDLHPLGPTDIRPKNPHDGLADACCLALYARWSDRGEDDG